MKKGLDYWTGYSERESQMQKRYIFREIKKEEISQFFFFDPAEDRMDGTTGDPAVERHRI